MQPSQSYNESKYKLIARHSNSHIQLKESEVVHEYLSETDKMYFRFSLVDDTDIDKIIFHITSISGEIDVYMNRDDKSPFPGIENSIREGFLEIESLKFTADEDGPLKGSYYISVEAYTASYFNVQVKVYRSTKNGQIKPTKQQIHYGETVTGYLYYNQPETLWFYPDKKYDTRKKTKVFLYFREYDTQTYSEYTYDQARPYVTPYFVDKNTQKKT